MLDPGLCISREGEMSLRNPGRDEGPLPHGDGDDQVDTRFDQKYSVPDRQTLKEMQQQAWDRLNRLESYLARLTGKNDSASRSTPGAKQSQINHDSLIDRINVIEKALAGSMQERTEDPQVSGQEAGRDIKDSSGEGDLADLRIQIVELTVKLAQTREDLEAASGGSRVRRSGSRRRPWWRRWRKSRRI